MFVCVCVFGLICLLVLDDCSHFNVVIIVTVIVIVIVIIYVLGKLLIFLLFTNIVGYR